MKKHYLSLFSATLFIIGALAQSVSKTEVIQSATYQKVNTELPGTNVGTPKPPTNRGIVNYGNFIQIGSTWYDLQTNYAMPHRLILHNNTVLAAWTTTPDGGSGFPNRGTGYNFRNSSNSWLDLSSMRLESTRTGWPCIGVLGNGKAFVLGHDADNGGFKLSKFNDNSIR